MKALSKLKKDFDIGVRYVPCYCCCTCDYPDGNFSANGKEKDSDNYDLANP